MNATCPNCGRVNRPGARYCASCQTLLGVSVRLQPGQLLDGGTYRVVRPLGKGGMGAVFLVAQTKAFDRLAVVKEVIDYYDPSDAGEREKAARRFEAEARTLGDLKHPGIPDLYAFFSERGHNYLVMEYIEGPDLRKGLTREDGDTGQLVPGGPLPVERVLRYVIQICEVLEYLTSRQPPVVHNDIKPGNIIIDEHSERAFLVDFGTAKTRYLRSAGEPDGKRSSVYGTVGYAAPELYRGHSEPRSDVFSLAATAYHLLTDDDPRDHPSQYPQLGGLPPSLADILEGALAEDVEDRPTASEFREQVQGYMTGQTAPLRALTFPDGASADERSELVALSIKYWHFAASILQDGTIARWLRQRLHDPVAAQAAESAVKQWPVDADAALDAFIRQLDPASLPPGKMELRTTSLRLLQAEADRKIGQTVKLTNTGQGYLRGKISSTQTWVKTGTFFSCPPGRTCDLPIEIDTTGMAPGQPLLAAVTLTPVGGVPDVVGIQVMVAGTSATQAPPEIKVNPERVDFTVAPDDFSISASVVVTNLNKTKARVIAQGAPSWLLVEPQTFSLGAGAKRTVKLIVRVEKVQDRKQKVRLTFALDGGQDQEIEVRLQIKRRGLFG